MLSPADTVIGGWMRAWQWGVQEGEGVCLGRGMLGPAFHAHVWQNLMFCTNDRS